MINYFTTVEYYETCWFICNNIVYFRLINSLIDMSEKQMASQKMFESCLPSARSFSHSHFVWLQRDSSVGENSLHAPLLVEVVM